MDNFFEFLNKIYKNSFFHYTDLDEFNSGFVPNV